MKIRFLQKFNQIIILWKSLNFQNIFILPNFQTIQTIHKIKNITQIQNFKTIQVNIVTGSYYSAFVEPAIFRNKYKNVKISSEDFYRETGISIKQIMDSFGDWDKFCRIAKPLKSGKK